LPDRTGRVRAVAHRGDSTNYPENTQPAFDACLGLGLDGIEVDLQMTRDGKVVCYHDRSLTKTGHRGWKIHRMNWSDIADLDVGSWFDPEFRHCRMLTLDEILERYAGETTLYLELKLRGSASHRIAMAERVSDRLSRLNLLHRCYLLCFDLSLLASIRARHGSARCVFNTTHNLADRIHLPQYKGLHALSVRLRGISPTLVTRAHALGMPVFGFTCDTEMSLRRLLRAGVDAVMSNRPAWLLRQLTRASQTISS